MVAVSIYIPTNSAEHSLFSIPSPAFIVCRLFDDSHTDWCEVISHCSYDLHFSNNEWCWASFHVFIAICMSSLEKCLFRSSGRWILYHYTTWEAQLNSKPGFGQTAFFPWQLHVPLKVKALASSCEEAWEEEQRDFIHMLQQNRTSREIFITWISLQDLWEISKS